MANHTPHVKTDDAVHDHGHGGLGKYLMVTVALFVLTAISFAVASSPLMNTPSAGWAIMMAVSCAKALLVIAFFMHMIWEANWKYVLTIPASMMSVFLLLMLVPDVGFRTWHYSKERWESSTPSMLIPTPATHGEHHGFKLPYTKAELDKLNHEIEDLKEGRAAHAADH